MTVGDLIKKKDYDHIVWYTHVTSINEDIFCGVSASKDGELISLDGDTYSEDSEVVAFGEFSNDELEIKNGLRVIVRW